MNIEITRMSSKGQIVIPKDMRKNIKEGEKLIIIENGKQLVIERVKDLDDKLKEDLEFARRTEEAWKRYDKGEFKEVSGDGFLKLLDKWSK
ncbi:MAG: AbrB/MazE/SpoVT family DNA-binding domain-containing protein [Nanoarchaeota archaeon]